MKKISKADLIRKPEKYLIGYNSLEKCAIKNKADEEIDYKYICKTCSSEVDTIIIEYSRKGDLKGTASKEVATYFCENCDKYFLNDYWIPQIDALADQTKTKLKILPELGINSSKELEIFCEILWDEEDYLGEFFIEEDGIKICVSSQSSLFVEALNLTTDYDLSDYGHDISETLKINPGMPYNPEQRKKITTLIAKLQMQIDGRVNLWTLNFKENFIEHEPEIYKDLCDLLIEWDDDRIALSILNEIYSGKGPGRFINVFRLLEYVLHICLLRDIEKIRFDRNYSANDFSELANQFQLDLKTKLKRRIDRLKVKPAEILQDLWHRISFGESYDEVHIYEKIIRFRNSLAHKPNKDTVEIGIQLPWEEPSFVGFTNDMLRLIHKIIKEN